MRLKHSECRGARTLANCKGAGTFANCKGAGPDLVGGTEHSNWSHRSRLN